MTMDAAWIGTKLGLFVRAVRRQIARNRVAAAVLRGIRATVVSFAESMHQLWLEVTGFTFLALAAMGTLAGLREYNRYHSGQVSGPGRVILASAFVLSFAWFGLSSFWRVRRRRKA